MQIESGGLLAMAHGNHIGGEAHASATKTSIQASRTMSAELEVVTAEGDRVSLSASQLFDVTLDRYETHLRAAGRQVRATESSLSVSRARSMVMEVDGDLNEQEVADIAKLIKDMDNMGAALLNGTLDASVALGGSLSAARGEMSVTHELAAAVSHVKKATGPGRDVYMLGDDDGDGRAPPTAEAPKKPAGPAKTASAPKAAPASPVTTPEKKDEVPAPATTVAEPSRAEASTRARTEEAAFLPGRAQQRAARRAGEIVRRHSERPHRMQTALRRLTNRLFDRFVPRFGQPSVEYARTSFNALLTREFRSVEGPAQTTGPTMRRSVNPYA